MDKKDPSERVARSFVLDSELLKQFKIACAQRDIAQSDAISLLIAYWLENPNIAPVSTKTEIASNQKTTESATVLTSPSGESEVVSSEEWPWVQQVLEIVRGNVDQPKKALEKNLDAFVWATRLKHSTEGGPHGRPPGAALPDSQPDLQAETRGLRKAENNLGPGMEELQQAGKDAERAGEQVKQTRNPLRKRVKRHRGSPGGRS